MSLQELTVHLFQMLGVTVLMVFIGAIIIISLVLLIAVVIGVKEVIEERKKKGKK